MKVFIITGASKGIGHALATILEAEGHKVLRIARTNPNQLPNLMTLDITEDQASQTIMNWAKPFLGIASEITLINNAGMIGPIAQIGNLMQEHVQQAITLNVTAPITLSNAFVALKIGRASCREIVNMTEFDK